MRDILGLAAGLHRRKIVDHVFEGNLLRVGQRRMGKE
jgi:hypothetical protein